MMCVCVIPVLLRCVVVRFLFLTVCSTSHLHVHRDYAQQRRRRWNTTTTTIERAASPILATTSRKNVHHGPARKASGKCWVPVFCIPSSSSLLSVVNPVSILSVSILHSVPFGCSAWAEMIISDILVRPLLDSCSRKKEYKKSFNALLHQKADFIPRKWWKLSYN